MGTPLGAHLPIHDHHFNRSRPASLSNKVHRRVGSTRCSPPHFSHRGQASILLCSIARPTDISSPSKVRAASHHSRRSNRSRLDFRNLCNPCKQGLDKCPNRMASGAFKLPLFLRSPSRRLHRLLFNHKRPALHHQSNLVSPRLRNLLLSQLEDGPILPMLVSIRCNTRVGRSSDMSTAANNPFGF